MIDNVAVEARRRPSLYTGLMLGYGRESDFSGVQLKVQYFVDLQALKVAEDVGRLRLGQEMMVLGIGANSEELHSVSYVAAISTSKKGAKAADMTPLVTNELKG